MELVVVLVLTAILASGAVAFLSRPLEGYRDLGRRAMLVDVSEGALRRIARDVRRALPNSVRISGGSQAVEILHSADGGKYRRQPGTNPGPVAHVAPSDWLSFAASGDAGFNMLGRFRALPFSYGSPLAAGTRLAIYSTSPAVYSDAAADANPGVITPSTTQITIVDDTDEDQLQLSAPFQFQFESPQRRFYVIDTPVSYLCDLGAGTLTRYHGYAITAVQPTNPAVAPLSGALAALVTNHVSACTFTYQPGTSQRAALLTVELTVSEDGEQARLLHQIHVENVP